MPKGIGQQQVAGKAGIAHKQIADRYTQGGSKTIAAYRKTGAQSGTITSPGVASLAEAWLIGGGGGNDGFPSPGAGGAGAAYKRWFAPANTSYLFTVGAGGTASGTDGGDTTLVLPTGTVTAGGGKGRPNGGLGGTGKGGDINRVGGAGSTSGGSLSGSGGVGGGNGTSGSGVGGGGSAGFGDVNPDDLRGGDGGAAGGSGPGNPPGGGGGNGSAPGADGRLVVTFVVAL